MNKLRIFDTTLRDGEQTPGVSLNLEEKLKIAESLDILGVDIIEAGFPISSENEFNAVNAISKAGLKAKICALARCKQIDIDKCIKADVDLVHIFIGTSPLHRKYKLNLTKTQILEEAEKSIQYCIDHGFKVHFSPEDACRTELDYLTEFCKKVESYGASIINIPDTVGIMMPDSMFELIKTLKKIVKLPLAVHCHNDFGLAVSNTLSAIKAGAEIPHVTINGLGERAGNADLEQTVLACKLLCNIKTNINYKKIYETSKIVERLSGIRIQPNFPIVGDNAFAHESGIHVHGVLAKAETYEPINPELIGASRKLVLGKHVGVHGVAAKLKEIGVKANAEQIKEITKKIKSLGDKNKRVTEQDLIAVARDVTGQLAKQKRILELLDFELYDKFNESPKAKVKLNIKGKVACAESTGVGPVDAALNAIKKACLDYNKVTLDEFRLDAITGGSNALAEVTLKITDENSKSVLATAVHEDIVMASICAFVNGLNKLGQ